MFVYVCDFQSARVIKSHIFFRLLCVVLYCLMFVSGKFLMPGQIRRYRWMLLAFAKLSQPGVVVQTFGAMLEPRVYDYVWYCMVIVWLFFQS